MDGNLVIVTMGTHNDHIECVVQVATKYVLRIMEDIDFGYVEENVQDFQDRLHSMATPRAKYDLLREVAGDMEIDVLECTAELFNGTERVDRHQHWGGR